MFFLEKRTTKKTRKKNYKKSQKKLLQKELEKITTKKLLQTKRFLDLFAKKIIYAIESTFYAIICFNFE